MLPHPIPCCTRLTVLSVRCRTKRKGDQLIKRSDLTVALTLSCQRRLDGTAGLTVETRLSYFDTLVRRCVIVQTVRPVASHAMHIETLRTNRSVFAQSSVWSFSGVFWSTHELNLPR
jgi:hypothetical protein